ncbi:MAG: HEAT repeat domain-containing protein [Anaerolineae bacterium]|nr:HEAT repeat domain-containing protein [Anaerolineae bacterium]
MAQTSESAKLTITGKEPALSLNAAHPQGQRRLSLRGLATMLNILPASAISLEALRESLKSAAFYVRYNAALKLAERGDRDARLVIQEVLNNDPAPSRASAARHLYGFSWFAAEPLIRLALEDSDSRVREGVVYAMCDMRDLHAYALMTEALRIEDEVDNVRDAAAWGLRDCHDPAAVPVLEAALLAGDPDVRVRALEALGANDTPQAIPVIREAMNDPEPDVKYAATLSLLEVAGEGWLQELSGVIGSVRGETLQAVLRGFFHASNYLKIDIARSGAADMMIDALESALLDDLPAARLAAVWPLAWMRHERTPIVLRQAYFRETDSEVKAQIVRVSVSLMSQAGEAILEDALNSRDPQVREVAETLARERAEGRLASYIE